MTGVDVRRPSRSVRWGNPGTLIVASFDLPDDGRMPTDMRETVRTRARHEDEEVIVSSHDVPFASDVSVGAAEWVGCYEATPHRDCYFRGNLFLTLCVEAHDRHRVGDALSHYTLQEVRRGDLVVLDPMVPHWLIGPEHERAPWAAVQWTVPKAQARDACRELVASLRGQWRRSPVDPRYAAWLPPGTTTRRTIVREEDKPMDEQHDDSMVPSGDGWTTWHGGPDAPSAALKANQEGDVDLAYRDGTRGRRRAERGAVPLSTFRWTHEGFGNDIVAWRLKRTFVGGLSPVFKRSGEVEVEGVSVGTYAKQDDRRHLFEPWGDGDQVPILRPRRVDLVDAIRAHAAAYAPDRFTTRWEPGP